MRPIELTVKGLHSFREKQTVDFRNLCEGGVFGIFGPTGSGKSSLLDAITLALYGRVERAAGSTQGILNHAEDELAVSLTFELGIDEPQCFRVERVYKRSKTDGLTIGSCRLLRLDQDEIFVLADKERDVTQQVKDILGLTHDDFTRAVVLPQGKFAEFLSLKGADRRRMLQRLFNMEKYGDRLNEVIKNRFNQTTNRLEAILSGQQELGDASKEALDMAQKAYADADHKVQNLSAQYEETKIKFDVAKQKREWQTALQNILDQEANLIVKKPEIDLTRDRVHQARLASLVLPFVHDYENIVAELQTARSEQEEAAKVYKEKSHLEEVQKKELDALVHQLTEETPAYEERREELRRAIQIHDDWKKKSTDKEQFNNGRNQAEAELQQKQQQISGFIKEREGIQSERDKLRESLKNFKVDISEREVLQKALSAKQEIENKQASYHEWVEQWKSLRVQITQNEAKSNTEKSQLDKATASLRQLFSQYEGLYYDMSSTKKGLDMVWDWLGQKEEDCQKAIQDITITHLTSELAGHLNEGVPCPVCGSVHHPNPATIKMPDQTENLKKEADFYKQCRQWINKALTSAGSYQGTLEQRVNQIQSMSANLVPQPKSRKETNFPDLSTWTIEDLKIWMTKTKDDLHGFKQDVLELDEQLKPLLEKYQNISNQFLILTTTAKEYGNQEKVLTDRIKDLKTTIDAHRKSWTETYAHLDYDQVEQRQAVLSEWDRKAHDLSERIDHLNQKIEKIDQEKQKLDEETNELKTQFARLDENLKEIEKALSELTSDYQKLMGDFTGDPAESLQQLEENWTSLKNQEAQKRLEWEDTKKNLYESEKHLSNTEALFKSMNKQAEEKSAKLIEQMKKHAFPTWQTVKDAVLSDSELAQAETAIKQFDEAVHHIKNEKESLQLKIGSDPISSEAFELLRTSFTELGVTRDQALEERAASKSEWTSLTDRHERFTQLEKERLELADLQSQFQKLMTIFRGNGFVEFLAEEQMEQISRDASNRLGQLTRRRYALEVDSSGGFVIRDDANGGIKRPVSSLSGGETFLTSLALALSLSTQIQLRGEVPLQFFFLDEGFGTLDQELLDTVITALEKLHTEQMAIGVISHVPELQERLARKLFVEPAEPSGRGSRLHHMTI